MIKLKSLLVIILSSILISCVILLTILGLSLYMGWQESEASKLHKVRIAALNARGYEKYINITDLRAGHGKDGIYKSKYLLEGSIGNSGYRTVGSVEVEVDFLNASGEPIYTETVLPLKAVVMPRKTTIAALSRFTSGKEAPVLPGESHKFKHILSDQKNKSITSPIREKRYATNPNEWSGKFNHRITKIRF
jgi:hypothetical protein